ncbi:polyketide synthase dehydratase domain-containing protein, partial [Streptomyces sp. NPDC059455]|uniref:polyketide synthase dehydratase domain-containing protein n=1 Tax=Streptomyces sp. NPDC059455 TaxID=3346837 RepID=UPI00368F2513
GPDTTLTALARTTLPPTTHLIPTTRRNHNEVLTVLTAAGQAHTSGVALDWSAIVPQGRRVELPTYPFQRERFWLVDTAGGGAEVEGAGLGTTDHPLLGAVTTMAESGELVLSGRLSTSTHPWLADHTVGDTVIVPGTALLDMAIRAGDETGHTTLDELVIHTPLTLTRPTPVQVTVGAEDDTGRRPISLHSRDTTGTWTRHATGTLNREAHSATELGAWPPADAHQIDLTNAYQRLADTGLHYGPAFQGLRALWQRESTLYAEVELPTAAGTATGHPLHPALLDAALHPAALSTVDAGTPRLPFSWTGVTVHATDATHLRVRLDTDHTGAIRLLATDTTGQPVITIDSLVTRPLAADHLRGARPGTDHLYNLDWSPYTPAAPTITVDCKRYTVPTTGDDVLADTHRITAQTLARVQEHLAADTTTPLVVEASSDDLAGAAVWGLVRTAQTEHPDRIVLIDTDDHPASQEVLPILVASGEPQARIRDGAITLPRLTTTAVTDALMPPGDTDAWHLDTSDRGTLENLTLTGSDADTRSLLPGEVRVGVRAAGLNFRDVLIALGMYPGEATMGS